MSSSTRAVRRRAWAWSAALAAVYCAITTPALADPCTAPLPARGQTFSGTVRYIVDGDSLCIGASSDPRTWIEVRLADFYAPELSELGGREAKSVLEGIAMGRQATCTAGKRSYDRVIGYCTIGAQSVGALLKRAGVTQGGNGRR